MNRIIFNFLLKNLKYGDGYFMLTKLLKYESKKSKLRLKVFLETWIEYLDKI